MDTRPVPGSGDVEIRNRAGEHVGIRPMMPVDAAGLLWFDGVPYRPLEGEPDTWVEAELPDTGVEP